MKTEDVGLDIKERFQKKGIPVVPAEVAMARNLTKEFLDFLLEIRRRWEK